MKLHIGCGKAYIPGWVNVDIISDVHADIYSNALALPYERESIDLIYASHVLEHFDRRLVLSALTHWYSLLKKEGILRLAVPDFEAIVEEYNDSFCDVGGLLGLLYGGQDHVLNIHRIAFDYPYLTKLLTTAGFVMTRRWNWRETEHSHIDDYSQAYLPHMDKEKGRLMSLNVEAIK